MRVLVAGGAGFIGSHIAALLIERGHDVLIMDDYSSGRKENLPPDARVFMPGSITYRNDWQGMTTSAIDTAVSSFHPDAICHQAAQPSLRRSIDDPAHDATVNIIGTINVLRAALKHGSHVVFASTSAVYNPHGGVFDEDSPIMPNLPYGIAKAAAENYIRASGVSATILRYGNVYGPRQVQVGENQLVPHALAHLKDGKPFQIHGDGDQTRDFVYVEDIARANVYALEERARGTYNAGTGRGVSVNQICALLDPAHDWQHGPRKAGEARHVALESSTAAQALGWRAEIGLAEGLRRTADAWGRA